MTVFRMWLNSAVCVVCVCVVSASQGDHCQGVVELCSVCCACVWCPQVKVTVVRVWLNSAVCVVCV